MGPKVCSAVLSILNGESMLSSLNFTHIVLISKVNNPKYVIDFRPISLCNVIYKLVSKVLDNRLKLILLHIISHYQSGFILWRLIIDNILIAYKLLHTMKNNCRGRKGTMVIKLDMSKIYDRVELSYIEAIMNTMSFNANWIRLIINCVTTIHYSILVNGRSGKTITPTRGMRQSDPISPYLFLICAKELSAVVNRAEVRGQIKGMAVTRGGASVNHLLFADDCVLFFRAVREE